MDSLTVIRSLGMTAHPEGGWYVETWRAAPRQDGTRPAGSAILYLLAEGERSRQFEVLVTRVMASPWRGSPARFLHPAANPTDADAVDRRFRPPTDDIHLATWLDWKRGGPPAGADTLVLTFGGEGVAGMDTVLWARGRYAGDALVLRRSSAAVGADSASSTPP